MNKNKTSFRVADILYLVCAIIPLIAGMVIKVLTTPETEGIVIEGARIFFTVKMPIMDMPITEAQVNSWLVIVSIFFMCLYLTHGISAKCETKRQIVAEWIVEKCQNLVNNNMGKYFSGFAPFVAAIMALSAFSSLLTLIGLYPPTSDLNIVAGWAILVFILITHYKMKCGPWHYMKSFAEPVAFLTPLNVISEVATPVSMAFRHYGNILSGTVISTLVAAALQGLSSILLGWLPGILGKIPFLQIGLSAILSVYFDVFSGCLQAFIFAMLTMLYISSGFPADDYEKMKAKRKKHKTVKN